MPLGDSITYGSPVPGGYRAPLYTILTNAGYNVDYVGTQTGNGVSTLPDSDHEGHGGWTIDGLRGSILSWFEAIQDPHVILVHIGTNDSSNNPSFSNAVSRLNALVTTMAICQPSAHIIVTSLMKRSGDPYIGITNYFNPYIPGLVANQAALGRRVTFLDMHAYLELSDMDDGLHPNAGGYAKMAAAWYTAITNVIAADAVTPNQPAMIRTAGSNDHAHVTITLNKALTIGTATNAANYAIDGGVSVTGAALSSDRRTLTLTTSAQTAGTLYTVTANNVADDDALTLSGSQITFTAVTPRGYANNVPESSNYRLVYSLDIPNTTGYISSAVPYSVDDTWVNETPTRVAYYLELQASGGDLQYLWVSMDAFTNREDKLGVPTVASGAIYQQVVTNMNVFCNVAGVTTGTGINTGNLEFWPSNYDSTNVMGIAGASNTAYDFGDIRTPGSYGSMQLHNFGAAQTLFAFNNWGGTGATPDLGIGNNASGQPDWTFMGNAGTYTVKTLQVLVLAGTPVAPTLVSATSTTNYNSVAITFGKAVDPASATNTANYSINKGITISGASISANQRTVTLTTSLQTAGTNYTVTVNNVTDQTTPTALTIAADSQITFFAPTRRGYLNNVAESSAYTLVYSLDIPNSADYGYNKVGYSVDNSAAVGPFRRVAYYMELQKPGSDLQYVWASMDAFATDAGKLGVPTVLAGALYKQTVNNMNVFCNVPGVVNGTGITTGNLEFWPSNYGTGNGAGLPGANGGAFDFDDSGYSLSIGHGSMQLHNYGAGQTLFGLNNWNGNVLGVGIGNNTDFSKNGTPYPDWTFSANANTYTVKTLQVLVLQDTSVDTTPPAIVSAQAGAAGTLITVVFSEKLAASSVDGTRFALNNGVSVLNATLFRDGKTVLLTTTPQPSGTALTLTVNGVRDLCANTIASGTTATVAAAALPTSLYANAGSFASGFKVVYAYDIPVTGDFNSSTASVLCDQSDFAGSFDRVAYYVELVQPSCATQYLWVAMDPFAASVKKLGIPTFASGEIYQQMVTNLDVKSNVSGITSGSGMSGGNIEFWPKDYSEGNAIGITNASSSTLDFGDTIASYGGSYGCMQIHNAGASQILFAMSHFGSDGNTLDIGLGKQSVNSPDWTFAANAGTAYARRTLYVLVRPKGGADMPSEIASNAGSMASGFRRVYTLDIAATGNFNSASPLYCYSKTNATETFDRIAYYAELVTANGTVQYVWAAMDAFTNDEAKIGVPTLASGAIYQQLVSNLAVTSNVSGVQSGTFATGGNLEFWPYDYVPQRKLGLTGASDSRYDFDDTISYSGHHGSMQIHNWSAAQTLFAINNWGNDGQTLSIGIGNNTGAGDPDWTFASNAGNYVRRTLHVFVRPTNATVTDPLQAPAEVTANVPEASNWQLAYIIDIPTSANFYGNAAAYYTVNNTTNGLTANFSRIAYYLALQSGTAATQYVWTAMDAFTTDASKIGVPVSGTLFQQRVTRLDVKSNVGGIVAGTGLDTGNIEFWPSNYGGQNDIGIPNANAGTFDFGDGGAGTGNGYGSMQVHNYGASQTLFAINNFNNNNTPCIGIGNNTDTSNNRQPDWTFYQNAGNYSSRRLYVFVLPGGDASDLTRPALYTATASKTLNRVAVTFSETLADSAANPAFFTLNNGASATGASLSADKKSVLLTTTALAAGQTYTLSVTGVRDRSVNGNLVIAGSSTTFTTAAIVWPSVLNNVPEASGYELIYRLPVGNSAYYTSYGCPYTVDESLYPKPFPFDRVAYCMELSADGVTTNWVYVSMDAYTADLSKIGVPTAPRGAAFQTYVGNMNVYASAGANVTTGTGITTGLIEFWPSNYDPGNGAGIPGASDTAFDFGDRWFDTSAGHGSMQIHNYAAAQTIFAFNQYSFGREAGLGIGNRASSSDPDWTFANNASSYAVKNIYVLARRGNTPPGLVTGTQPTIWTQPVSVEVLSGKPVLLTVGAANATSYQWRKNGVWIPGATQSWLAINPTAGSDSGSYDVLAFGSGTAYATSQAATVKIDPYGTLLLFK